MAAIVELPFSLIRSIPEYLRTTNLTTVDRSRCDPVGAKAPAQIFHRIDHRSAECLSYSLIIAKATRSLAVSRHNCIAFAPEGLCIDRWFTTNNPRYLSPATASFKMDQSNSWLIGISGAIPASVAVLLNASSDAMPSLGQISLILS